MTISDLDRMRAVGSPLLRIIPQRLCAGRPQVVMERNVFGTSAFKWTLISGFFEPLFYLVAMGAGVGALVGAMEGPHGLISYAAFIAPGLMATSAMNGAVYDSTVNVYYKMRFGKTYDAMLSTSLGPLDVALGEIAWALARGAVYAICFELVMVVMGLTHSLWALLAVPAAIVIALGFAAIGMAITSFVRTFQQLDLVTFAVMPMFLFSTTFYPLSVYPRAVQIVVECFPLYHGVELIRGLTLGNVSWALAGHASYFVVMAVIGITVTSARLEKLLLR